MKQVTIKAFALTIKGLSITYAIGKEITVLTLDPKATCSLFESRNMVEGFDIDQNGEPVIYYIDNIWNRPVTAFCRWYEFVKTFPFIQRHAEILVEHLIDVRVFQKTQAKIHYLLNLPNAA